jgi:hypothetical protein
MKGCCIGMVDSIICSVIISLCLSIVVGTVFYYKLNKKHEKEVSFLKAQICSVQERWIWLEERYAKHEAKYHR